MPLPIPNLDDRNFDQLSAEARALIPRHFPAVDGLQYLGSRHHISRVVRVSDGGSLLSDQPRAGADARKFRRPREYPTRGGRDHR